MDKSEIALGVKVFYRTQKLNDLLNSIEGHPISTVYVADDGKTEERRHLYDKEYSFNLKLLDLEYDAGQGYGHEKIAEVMNEDYLLLTDPDHRIININPLMSILSGRKDLGGVAGLLYKTNGQIQGNAHDLYEYGNTLVRDINNNKNLQYVEEHPLVEFDFVPGVGLFRREALEDYSWDPEYVIGKDHLDFYVGHWRETDWNFAVYPGLVLFHNPGGSSDYLSFRLDTRKTWHGKSYFLKKWGYDQIVMRDHWKGITSNDGTIGSIADSALSQVNAPQIPIGLHKKLVNIHDIGMKSKAKLYDIFK